jgi:hypothetical protein
MFGDRLYTETRRGPGREHFASEQRGYDVGAYED